MSRRKASMTGAMKATIGLGGVFVLLASAVAFAGGGKQLKAKAEIRLCSDPTVTIGSAKLKEKKSDEGIKLVTIDMKVKGLSPGKHGVHIHEVGDCGSCAAARGHFDPGPSGNSSPDLNHPFHSGDLVNIEGGKGSSRLKTETTRITLSAGPLSVFDEDGSAFIIHNDEDTYCPDGFEEGCAGGSRFACGVIEQDS